MKVIQVPSRQFNQMNIELEPSKRVCTELGQRTELWKEIQQSFDRICRGLNWSLNVKQLPSKPSTGQSHHIEILESMLPEVRERVQFSMNYSTVTAHYEFFSTIWGFWTSYHVISMSRNTSFVNLLPKSSLIQYHEPATYTLNGITWTETSREGASIQKIRWVINFFVMKKNGIVYKRFSAIWPGTQKWPACEKFIQ